MKMSKEEVEIIHIMTTITYSNFMKFVIMNELLSGISTNDFFAITRTRLKDRAHATFCFNTQPAQVLKLLKQYIKLEKFQ